MLSLSLEVCFSLVLSHTGIFLTAVTEYSKMYLVYVTSISLNFSQENKDSLALFSASSIRERVISMTLITHAQKYCYALQSLRLFYAN